MTLRNIMLPALALLGSFSTLLCCALPALLVSIGAGAVMAGLVSTIPQIVWLSEHKILLFTGAGVLLILSAILRYLSRNAPCPADPAQAKACMRLRSVSLGIFSFSLLLYIIGFIFAFILPAFI